MMFLTPLTPFPFPAFLSPQIPASTINALSYEQLIRQFLYKLNEVVERCNSVQEFSEEVRKELAEFNEVVDEKVLQEITRLYENGDLEEILARVSASYFAQYEELLREYQNSVNSSLNTIDTRLGRVSNSMLSNLFYYPNQKELRLIITTAIH